jgi:beta-lactamase regulating signal transducer with metallopeptidase domain/protocatechuate 3,4-dioxygenase beta subunit
LPVNGGTIVDAILEQINSMGNAFVGFALPMLVQSSILIMAILALDLLLRRKVRAVSRYWIWMIVLVKLVLPTNLSSPTSPAYWFGADLQRAVVQETITAQTSEIVSPIIETSTDSPAFPEAMSEVQPVEGIRRDPGVAALPAQEVVKVPPTMSSLSIGWPGIVLLVWLAAVITMMLLLIQRTFSVKGLIAQSKEVSPKMLTVLQQGRQQIKVSRRVALRLSPLAPSPSVCGLFRPTILMPQSLADKLDSQHLRSIFLHELAHIKRGDLWVSLFQTILQIVYVYNPLLWVANAMIRKVREDAVDETVLVAMGEQAELYPRTLLDVSRLSFSQAALSLRLIGVVESKKALAERIRHMVGKPFPKTAKLGVIGFLGVTILGAVLLPMARAQKDDAPGLAVAASTALAYEGQLAFHQALPVGMTAGTDEHPELVHIEWVRFETIAGNAWGVTARVGWSPVTNACWRLKVELLDREGRVLQHPRDEATMFTCEAGHAHQAGMHFAVLELDYLQYEGRRHARRFRVQLEPWQAKRQSANVTDSEMHTLELVVIDQKSQTPMADAAVVVRGWYRGDTGGPENALYATDGQGRCQIGLASDGLSSVRIGAQKQGFARNRKSWTNSGSWPVGGTMLVSLPQRHILEMIRAGSVGGLVQDEQGKPLSEVEVRFNAHAEDASGMTYVRRSVQTNAEGRWQVDGVPLELGLERMSVGLRHAEYGGDNGSNRYLTGQALLDARALKHVETLTKGLTVIGKVLNERGEPVVSATVMMESRSFNPMPTLTDASGAFRWVCMADVSAYREPPALTIEAPGYAPIRQSLDLTQTLDGLKFRLTRGRTISCRALDTEGKPLKGARTVVQPHPENTAYSLWMKETDADGEFQIPNMPENDVAVTVLKSGYIAVRDFVVGASEHEAVITLRRAMSVSGTITDAKSKQPIPNFEIATVFDTERGRRTGTPSAFTQGSYDLSIREAEPEALQFRASAVGYEPATSQEIKVDEGQHTIDFALARSSSFDATTAGRPREEVKPTGPRRITGVVRDGQGNPVSGALVSTRPWIAENVRTDAQGAFALRTMRISGPREKTVHVFARHEERNLAAALELESKAKALEIKLLPGTIASGRVVDSQGKGIAPAEIVWRFWYSGSGSPARKRMKVNAEGAYEIRAIPSGHRYSVTASAEGYGERYVMFNTAEAVDDRIELAPLVLAVAEQTISGVVVDVEGRPVPDARVNAYGRGQPSRHTSTDEQGRFVIENMCQGRIQIQAGITAPRRLHARDEVEGGATDIKIVVTERDRRGRTIPKQAPSLKGKPLPDLTGIELDISPEQYKGKMILVCLWDMNQRPSRNCITQLGTRNEQLQQKGISLIAIQATKVDEEVLNKWVRASDIPFPIGSIGVDYEKIRSAWGAKSLPWLILTDKNHIVQKEGFSLSQLDEEEL